jgi:hypothetical protein
MLRVILTIGAAMLSSAMIFGAENVDDIIAKNIEARGGISHLLAIKTIREAGQLRVGNFRAAFVQENKRGDRVREEFIIQGLAQVQAYDGKTGWQINPFSGRKDPELLSADDSKSLIEDADLDGQLVNYKEKGHKAELVGHDAVEGTDCYKIKLTLKNGDLRYYYLDTDSFLELKIETQRMIRGTVEYRETVYGDYEQVNGVYFPFAFENSEKGNPQHMKFNVEKVEVNVPLDDNLFAAPAAKVQPKVSTSR